MPQYRVRRGMELGHHGRVVKGGEAIELPEDVASDSRVASFIEQIPPVEKVKLVERVVTPQRVARIAGDNPAAGVKSNGADSE